MTLDDMSRSQEQPRSFTTARPYFTRVGAGYQPTTDALSNWGVNMIAGPPVLGLLARTVETNHGDPDFFAARLTADLFRSVRTSRIDVRSRIIRWGNRIRVVEAELIQAGAAAARATVVFYRKSRNAAGDHWTDLRVPEPPVSTEYAGARLIGTSGDDSAWVPLPCDDLIWSNGARKRLWASGWSVVDGEDTSPFTRAAMMSDLTNLVTNMSSAGIGYINGDVTLALTRLPEGSEVGLEADDHRACEGVMVGAATLFDRTGVLGVCSVSGLANEPRGRRHDAAE